MPEAGIFNTGRYLITNDILDWIFQHRNRSSFVAMDFIHNGVQYNCIEEDMNIATNGILNYCEHW